MSPQVSGAWRFSWLYAAAAALTLVIGGLLLSGLPLLARQTVSAIGLVGGSLAVAASCLDRLRRTVGRRRRSWALFGLAGLLAAASNAEFYLHAAFGFPLAAMSTGLLLLALLCGVAGVVVYPSAARRTTDLTRMVLDGVVIGGSALFIASVTVFPQVFATTGGDVAAGVLALLPPVFDVVMATLATLLFLRSTHSDRLFLGPVSLGFVCYALSDFAFTVGQANGGYVLGSVSDLGWIAGWLSIAIGLSQAPVASSPESAREASPIAGTVVMFSLFIAAAVVSFVQMHSGQLPTGAAVLWLIVLFGVTARQVFLILDNEQLRRILEDRVVQRSHQLRQVTEQAELLVNSVGDGIYGVDRAGVITFVNPAASEILHYVPEDLIGQRAHDLFHAPRSDGAAFPADGCYIAEAIWGRIATSAEDDVYVQANGQLVHVEVTATPLTEGDSVRGAVVVFRDVTQRREMDRLKSEFVSMVSHELRTPLTAIRGSLGLLAGGALGPLDQRAERMIKIALDSSERLSRMINDILDVERLEAGAVPMNLTEHDVSDLVDAAVAQLHIVAADSNVTVRVLATPGHVIADADWVQQTLLNLIGNAIKFSPPDGVVDVYSTVFEDVVEIAIRDQGRGIPAEKLESIFARFEQVDSSDRREKGGTGLGLAISRSLVERLGGRIWAENNSSGGATFRFTLPRPRVRRMGSTATLPHAVSRPLQVSANGGATRVDDNATLPGVSPAR